MWAEGVLELGSDGDGGLEPLLASEGSAGAAGMDEAAEVERGQEVLQLRRRVR